MDGRARSWYYCGVSRRKSLAGVAGGFFNWNYLTMPKRDQAEYMRQWRKKHPGYATQFKERKRRYQAANPIKVKARKAVENAVARGKLTRPDHCTICLVPGRPHAHHPDYSRPLDVIWCCLSCHRAIHKALMV